MAIIHTKKFKVLIVLEKVSDSLEIKQGIDIDRTVVTFGFEHVINNEYMVSYKNPKPLLGDDKTLVFVLDDAGDIVDRYYLG